MQPLVRKLVASLCSKAAKVCNPWFCASTRVRALTLRAQNAGTPAAADSAGIAGMSYPKDRNISTITHIDFARMKGKVLAFLLFETWSLCFEILGARPDSWALAKGKESCCAC